MIATEAHCNDKHSISTHVMEEILRCSKKGDDCTNITVRSYSDISLFRQYTIPALKKMGFKVVRNWDIAPYYNVTIVWGYDKNTYLKCLESKVINAD